MTALLWTTRKQNVKKIAKKSTFGTTKVNRSCKISDPLQLWKLHGDDTLGYTLENKEKGDFSSKTWIFKPLNSQTNSLIYIEKGQKVLQATSGNKVKLATKVTLPGSGQLWKKGNPNIEGYYTLKNSDFSRFLTAKDTEKFRIKGKIKYTAVPYSNQIGVVAFNVPQLTFLISVMLRWHRASVACKNQSF